MTKVSLESRNKNCFFAPQHAHMHKHTKRKTFVSAYNNKKTDEYSNKFQVTFTTTQNTMYKKQKKRLFKIFKPTIHCW